MKRRTIQSVINKKIKEWTDTISDTQLRKEVKDNIIVTGGCFISLWDNETPHDFDVYIRSRNVLVRLIQYYLDVFNEANNTKAVLFDSLDIIEGKLIEDDYQPPYLQGVSKGMMQRVPYGDLRIFIRSAGAAAENQEALSPENMEKVQNGEEVPEAEGSKYRPVFVSANAITLSDKIQLITRFWGEAEEIHENFDFIHCTNYWESWTSKVIFNPGAMESYIAKTLHYQGSKFPLCSIIRLRKFIKRGWQINAGQMLKMMYQVSKFDLNDIGTLENQLTGVDSLYFNSLIHTITKAKEEAAKNGEVFEIDAEYIAVLVDKIFG